MPSVCFYFQVHQPYRVTRGSMFQIARDHWYFDDQKNGDVLRKVAAKCYIPATRTLTRMVKRYGGDFRVSFSITGTAIEQMRTYSPEALECFQELIATGHVEVLGETYYHSLSALYSPEEFTQQVLQHRALMQEVFHKSPEVFRNTELIYDNSIGQMVSKLGMKAVLAEGWDPILGWRSPNFVYQVQGAKTRLLLKNYKLSDDVAFRFSNRGWECYPLTADKFASWIHALSGNAETVNLFMDYETFGEHQWADSGIFDFLEHLPEHVLRHRDWNFATPSEVLTRYPVRDEVSYPYPVSWADTDRDISAWRGNEMQDSALAQVYALRMAALKSNNPDALSTWRKLLTSDHFYYMCTKWFADGDVHAYFSPFDSPYEAFVSYMNVLRDFRQHQLGLSASIHGGGEA